VRTSLQRALAAPTRKNARAQLRSSCSSSKKGESADAADWIKQPGHTLGERDAAASRRLIARLKRLGCTKVAACEIRDGSTGHLVVELPNEPQRRKKIFRALDGLAENVGYEGDSDDGQRLEYIKLD
jgi:hypothetical protein